MLSTADAKAQLQSFLLPREEGVYRPAKRFQPSIEKLPKKLKLIALTLADINDRGFRNPAGHEDIPSMMSEMISKLSTTERRKIMKLFFGTFTPYVELTWDWLSTQPYNEYSESSFRAPSRPELARHSQYSWLRRMVQLAGYVKDGTLSPEWIATWAAHLTLDYQSFGQEIAMVCAAVMDSGKKKDGEEVFQILRQSLTNDHEIAAMGGHIIIAFLSSNREDGWQLIEQTLLAAQRQEGLRQSILERAESGRPQAIARMLQLIIDNNLLRFSSVVQAMDHWFGLSWTALAKKQLTLSATRALEALKDAKYRKRAYAGDDAEDIYYALWAEATEDAAKSVTVAKKLIKSPTAEVRYVTALHLSHLPNELSGDLRTQMLADEDLRVVSAALFGSNPNRYYGSRLKSAKLFEAVEQLLERWDAKQKLPEILWPWTEQTIDRTLVAKILPEAVDDRPLTRLVPYMGFMESWTRASIVKEFGEIEKWDANIRDLVVGFIGDRNIDVSLAASSLIKKRKLKPDEAERLESYLTRTGTDFRKNIITLLMTLPDEHVLESADRLLQAAKQQRMAGLELLRKLCENDRSKIEAIKTTATWIETRKKLLKAEQIQVDSILESNDDNSVTLDDGLGLFDPESLSIPTPPKNHKVQCYTNAIPKLLKSLDDLIHKNREESVTYKGWGGETTELLGNIRWGFPTVDSDVAIDKQKDKLPLLELWQKWFKKRPKSLRDKDGLELLRASWYLDSYGYRGRPDQLQFWSKRDKGYEPLLKFFGFDKTPPRLRYDRIVDAILDWLVQLNPPSAPGTFVMDVYETALSMLPKSAAKTLNQPEATSYEERNRIVDWRHLGILSYWRIDERTLGKKLTKAEIGRAWNLETWRNRPAPQAVPDRPSLKLLMLAYQAGCANLTDVADHLIGARRSEAYHSGFDSLSALTYRPTEKAYRPFLNLPEISQLLDSVRDRIVEVELLRGEGATPASDAAIAIKSYEGTDVLLKLLRAIGKDGFKKVQGYRSSTCDNKLATFTDMVSSTFPAETDTEEEFVTKVRQAIKDGDFPEERLLQLAFLAPQWIPYVEKTIAWNGFGEGILWYLAHMGHIWQITRAFETEATNEEPAVEDTKADSDDESDEVVDAKPEKLTRFERLIREQTSLSRDERENGAIDVPWFHRTYEKLSPERFDALAAAARFATTTQAAKKAQYVADVLLGNIPKSEIVEAIKKKNLKEKVRLLGLLPLDKKKTQADILDRYEVLQEYLRYAKKLSSMSRPDALRSYEIGMQNLASTAGFDDPIRLQWTLEAASTKDLAAGPVVVQKDDVSLTLELDQDAKPFLTIRRGEKVLKSLPKKVNKEPEFVELRERNKHLKRQVSRVKEALEVAMVRQDTFTGAELMQLSDHALLWPQLSRLILVGQGIMGYPVKGGKGLMDHSGKVEPVKKKETLRIAHPHDLLKSKAWSKWQKDCFQQERLQPFKQVFRELYVVTAQEKKDKTSSSRYAAQQVNPRQAFALWGRRGWSVDEYGDVFKAFPNQDLVVSVSFNHGFTTPLEVEGLTLENVHFRSRDSFKPIPVTKVDPIMFSEIMRDMDLVVSVAHVGEVDPETSSSTVEMRSALLKETCQLLGLKNVKLKNNHAMIKGSLAQYTVHLGSGVVHCQPGGAVCLVPVHSQHRGRLFLPFADDDPRTAEVISKTLLLAKDEEIQDPIILDQLRAMA